MVTAHRPQFIERACRYFLDQTYPNRELVIIDNGESPIRGKIPASPMIRYFHSPRQGQTIGGLRNSACDVTSGTIVAHWDDDDWYHPNRLAFQVEALGAHELTGFSSCLWLDEITDGGAIWKYDSGGSYVLGSSLMYQRSAWRWHQFEELPHPGDRSGSGEDGRFQDVFHDLGKPAIARAGIFPDGRCMMIARMHETNTQRQQHDGIRRWLVTDPERIRANWTVLDDPATLARVRGLLA